MRIGSSFDARLRRTWLSALLAIALTLSLASGWNGPRVAANENGALPEGASSAADARFGAMYYDVHRQWVESGAGPAGRTFRVNASDYVAASDEAALSVENYDGAERALVWRNQRENWVEYRVDVPETGLYEMVVRYRPYGGARQSNRPMALSVMWDGEYVFREARSIRLPRLFRDDLPLRKDRYGDHIRPQSIEIERWETLALTDSEDSYNGPLQWRLTEGVHTLRLHGHIPIALDAIEFRPPGMPLAYRDTLTGKRPSTAGGEPIVIEAEEMLEKNEVSVQILSDQDAWMSPRANGATVYNGVGGNRWDDGGERITWRFDVPENGWYNIAFRALNNLRSNVASYRKIRIDGEVPFQELLAFAVPYANQWQKVVLADEAGDPYAFYLEAGEHTISMSVTYAPHKELQALLEKAVHELAGVSRDLQMLTNAEDDPNRTWDIAANFPEIPGALRSTREKLERMAQLWLATNKRKDNNYQSLRTAISDIDNLTAAPNDIPNRKNTLSTIQSKVASVTEQLKTQPLALDQIVVTPHGTNFPKMTASVFEKLWNGLQNFARSFVKENQLSDNDEGVLNVWMNYGRDYVNLLQELADQYFTPKTGIPVKIDLLPREELLVLANATNQVPDVAIGIGEGKPSEFAFRNAAVDLSTLEGFDELVANFAPGSMLPYYYDGGYYAIPETAQLKMLFYRKDILEQLGLSVPDTWDDVFEMIPTLQQNGYNFYVPNGELLMFVYQNGADFYAEDGMKTGLDSPQGFAAFKQFSDLFSLYGVDRQISSFYQHFRDGDIPIGVADLNSYLQLLVAAPELTGWWDIAPVPGAAGANGETARWSGGNMNMLSQGLGGFGAAAASSGAGGQTSAMIMKRAQNPEWGWEFLRWWMSSEVQELFGSELEGFYGAEFRWSTVNLKAFAQLPWTPDELDALLEQWRWYKSMVNVPGSYFIPRELNNAWNRTVVDGMNYRRSLEIAVMNINRELLRKQTEFGFRDENGTALRSFGLPDVSRPWEGVDRSAADQ